MRRRFALTILAFPCLALFSGCRGSVRADFNLSGIEGTTVYESEKNFASTTVDPPLSRFQQRLERKGQHGTIPPESLREGIQWQTHFRLGLEMVGGRHGCGKLPEIQVGHSPWAGEVAPNSGFPFRVGSKKLVVDYDVSMRASGSYDLAFEFWAVSSHPSRRAGSPTR